MDASLRYCDQFMKHTEYISLSRPEQYQTLSRTLCKENSRCVAKKHQLLRLAE